MNSEQVMRQVTARFVELIEAGAVGKWEMPWRAMSGFGAHRNMFSHHHYQGGNAVALAIAALDRGYSQPCWATYQQWQAHGCAVQRGQKATQVLFFKPFSNDETPATSDDEPRRRGGVFRVFHVFNVAQIDGWVADPVDVTVVDDPTNLTEWFAGVPVSVREGNPSYYPALDVVYMPPLDRFVSVDAWAGTFAHELVHWSGHADRLGRDLSGRFGDEAYAMEELIAELGASMVCVELGIDPVDRSSDHAAYLAGWLRVLKADPSALWTVASRASAGAQFVIASRVREKELV